MRSLNHVDQGAVTVIENLSLRRARPLVTLALAAVMVMASSGCYVLDVQRARADGSPMPWFCAPTAFNSVTGIGMGSVNFYAGRQRKVLLEEDCTAVATQMDAAKAYAQQYPTAADAEADGFTVAFPFFSGMGTHHGKSTLTPEVINAPGFDRLDPILPGTDTFDPTRPNFLQYDGNGPDARLVGMSWYVRSTTGPPAGLVGGNDWWHHHPTLCVARATGLITGVLTTDASCRGAHQVNLDMSRYYMLHLWVVDDMEYRADVFAPTHPCVGYGGTVFDQADPCHDTPPAPTPRRRAAPTAVPVYCPLGQPQP